MTEPDSIMRAALEQLLSRCATRAVHTARLVKHVGARLDAMSLDLARDAGAVVRNAQALRGCARAMRGDDVHARDAARDAASRRPRRRCSRASAGCGSPRPRAATRRLRDEDHRDLARRTAAYAAELRGGIAKLGQLASCRPDLVGPIWAARARDAAGRRPARSTRAAIRARIEAELGRPIGEVFAEFDDAPLAAASLAQVHAARLLDGTRGRRQGPGARHRGHHRRRHRGAAHGRRRARRHPRRRSRDAVERARRARSPSELDYDGRGRARCARYAGSRDRAASDRARHRRARVLTMTRIDGERLTDVRSSRLARRRARSRCSASWSARSPRRSSRAARSTPIRTPATSWSPPTAGSRCSTSAACSSSSRRRPRAPTRGS